LKLEIASLLPHVDFFNFCFAFERCKKSSRAYTAARLKAIVKSTNALIVPLYNQSLAEGLLRAFKVKVEEELYDFYLTLLTTRGLENCFRNNTISIMKDTNMFSNQLPAPIFLAWHKAIFSTRWASKHIRLGHMHGTRNCGICSSARAISRLSFHSAWEAGGWPVVRDNGDGTANYMETIHSTTLSPTDILKYPGDYDSSSYHILWPYGQSIVSERVLNLSVILHSYCRDHLDETAYQYATLISQ